MNKNLMFSSATSEWSTPQELFDELNKEFNFTIDVCATKENAKLQNYFNEEENGLSKDWDYHNVWCNPPYGREIGKWVKKCYVNDDNTCYSGYVRVMLLPARTDTRWFHDYIYKKNRVEIRFIKGRLKFGNSKNSAPFPSMIVIFR